MSMHITDSGQRIVTYHIYPPIPVRDFDWCAYADGGEEWGGYGYGPTEEEAIRDYLEQIEESV